jgi:hypothetical protein
MLRNFRRHFTGRFPLIAAFVAAGSLLTIVPAIADDSDNDRDNGNSAQERFQKDRASVIGEILRLAGARHDRAAERASTQSTPAIIPKDELDLDQSGLLETYNPSGPTVTKKNAFFQDLGTNGRTCFTCHQPDQAWSVTPDNIKLRFLLSGGQDPIFRPVDGAVCTTADTSTLSARKQAYSLLLNQGLIRIPLAVPASLQFTIAVTTDPYGCNANAATGLTSATTGTVSAYRRPLPSTNLGFLSAVMNDGREGGLVAPTPAAGQPTLVQDLSQQAIDATLGHAQAATAPTAAQVADMVTFEMGLTTAQVFDIHAFALNAAGATGGAVALSQQPFYIGINDSAGKDPTGAAFNNVMFTLYNPWAGLTGNIIANARAAVARGETLFNTRSFNVTGVAGFNDVKHAPVAVATCSNCHDTPNVGNHSVMTFNDIGVNNPAIATAAGLNVANLPVYTVTCSVATFFNPANTPRQVTDIGRATISGNCIDIGKIKAPTLRGLAGRAPYFHNGGAAQLIDVVNFYNTRFAIGFTDQEKADLVAFLQTL